MHNTFCPFGFWLGEAKVYNSFERDVLNSYTLPYDITCSYLTMYLTDDFKPASVDTTRPAELVVGDTNEITVTMPHVQVQQD